MQIKIMDIKKSLWAIVLLIITSLNNATVAKKLNASQAFDETWNTASDLENELEQKRARGTKGANAGGSGQWSAWSDWSSCSRTCDGGIMQQIRRCHNTKGCRGESVRHRICNMQSCPEQQDFRAHQCEAFNDVPYDGALYRWTPHYDYVEPCALTCRGRPAHLSDDVSLEAGEGEDPEQYDEPSVIVQLSAQVEDGTRCRSGSLDMCIQGKCQRVGCDLKIGSTKKIDDCGVCGGDGSSCSKPLYQWETAPMSICSVSCGGGYKISRPICRNRETGADGDDSLCNASNRPEPSVVMCNTHSCPPKWITDEWSPCSRLCGAGFKERLVVCAEENNGIKTRVADVMCQGPNPPAQEQCIVEECPKWEVEEWTGCSVSCGHGLQMRGVECKSSDGKLSAKCDPTTKPPAILQCSSGTVCDGGRLGGGGGGGSIIVVKSSAPLTELGTGAGSDDDSLGDEDEDGDDEGIDEKLDDDSSYAGGSDDTRDEAELLSYNDHPPMYAHHSVSRMDHEELPEPKVQRLVNGGPAISESVSESEQPSAEPTFIKDNDWSPCSVTCGEGIRRRPYKCKIFLEYSRTVATVNDTLCEGPKPHDEAERCVEDPCMLPSHGYDEQYPRDSIKVGVSEPGKTYVWREQGYTSCSASCLGGVEELIINCVREDNGRVVSPFLCSPETKPEARVRTCNDRPCPPRWNYSDYTPCSKSCGIGIKTREVQCIHEVTRGGENTMVVPNSMCPQPPPADRQYCNVLDCPVRWEVGEWSKCSHSCGYGIKERKVECKQIMAQEHKVERPETMCPSAKPPDKKPCNVKACPPDDPKPIIAMNNSTHIQHDPKKSKITLKIGGAAVVFFGTQVKIKCPVKRYNRTKIRWNKDSKPLTRSRKFKVSKKGALRILDITFRDAGIYSCHAGFSSAEINIEVKAKPGGQQPEDFDRLESDRLVRERSGTEALTSADMTAGESVNGSQTTRRKVQSSRERSRRPTTDEVQHADSSVMKDEYLWPFQKFGNSRGHHMLFDKGLPPFGLADWERYEKDEPAKPMKIVTKDLTATSVHVVPRFSQDKLTTLPTATAEDAAAQGQRSADDNNFVQDYEPHTQPEQPEVTYKWVTSDWTECSQKCDTAGAGLRHRTASCLRSSGEKPNFEVAVVGGGECADFGLNMPATIEGCAPVECPRWVAGSWTLCPQSRCFGRNTAIQKRAVSCQHANGTAASSCDDNDDKPISRQECYNERCKGVWRVEPWSACNAPCGRQGIKYRILQCVWYGTRRPAGNACRHQPRPAVMKVCKSPPCRPKAAAVAHCKDASRYCRNVRSMGLCRLQRYQDKCCRSCKFSTFN